MIICIINYIKKRDNLSLILMIAEILIVISDTSIGFSILFNSNIVFSNIMCLIIWPTYITACVLLNC